jgi:hypothetical protein
MIYPLWAVLSIAHDTLVGDGLALHQILHESRRALLWQFLWDWLRALVPLYAFGALVLVLQGTLRARDRCGRAWHHAVVGALVGVLVALFLGASVAGSVLWVLAVAGALTVWALAVAAGCNGLRGRSRP